MSAKTKNPPGSSKRPAFVKKSYSMPRALHARMLAAMKARGLTNESAFIHTALVQMLAEQSAKTTSAAA